MLGNKNRCFGRYLINFNMPYKIRGRFLLLHPKADLEIGPPFNLRRQNGAQCDRMLYCLRLKKLLRAKTAEICNACRKGSCGYA